MTPESFRCLLRTLESWRRQALGTSARCEPASCPQCQFVTTIVSHDYDLGFASGLEIAIAEIKRAKDLSS